LIPYTVRQWPTLLLILGLIVATTLDRLMQGRTTFIIAHRLFTIRNVDRIVVLEEGKVLEEGSHNKPAG